MLGLHRQREPQRCCGYCNFLRTFKPPLNLNFGTLTFQNLNFLSKPLKSEPQCLWRFYEFRATNIHSLLFGGSHRMTPECWWCRRCVFSLHQALGCKSQVAAHPFPEFHSGEENVCKVHPVTSLFLNRLQRHWLLSSSWMRLLKLSQILSGCQSHHSE